MKSRFNAEFSVLQITDEYIYIVDDCAKDSKSLTHDVENVLSYLTDMYKLGNKRLFYRDTDGQIDEIVHENGKFIDFAPGFKGIADDLYNI